MASKLGSGVVVMDEKPTAEGTASATSDDDVGSRTQEAVPVLQTPKKTWRSYVWDTFDKSPEERRFLFKLDAVILTFASLGMCDGRRNFIGLLRLTMTI
jgi:MFS transporter, ACS family, pantothenate transporter